MCMMIIGEGFGCDCLIVVYVCVVVEDCCDDCDFDEFVVVIECIVLFVFGYVGEVVYD